MRPDSARRKELRLRRRAQGLCVVCGEHGRPGKALCAVCAQRQADASRRSYLSSNRGCRWKSLERRWCRIALLACGSVVTLHAVDLLGLQVGTVRTHDLSRMFGIRESELAALRNNRETRYARRARRRLFPECLVPEELATWLPEAV